MATANLTESTWERMFRVVEDVRRRLARATAALDRAGVAYAIIGGNAVAAWVARVDEAAVRNTQDIDVLLRRDDLGAAKVALERAGFVFRHVAGIDRFLDCPGGRAKDAVHVVFAGEKVRPEYEFAAPDVSEAETDAGRKVLALEALVRMKLTSHRLKDRVHIQDLISVGLVDQTWLGRLPEPLNDRLRELLENPEA